MLTRNVKNVILFTKFILNSLLPHYLVMSNTFCNFAAVENPLPCQQRHTLGQLGACIRWQDGIKLFIIMYYG